MGDWSRWGEGDGVEKRAPSLADADAQAARDWWARLQRNAGNPRSIEAFNRASFGTDTRAILPTIHVPTLVVHRRDDRAVDVGNGRYLAEHIAGAKYVELPGIDHIPWIEPDEIDRRDPGVRDRRAPARRGRSRARDCPLHRRRRLDGSPRRAGRSPVGETCSPTTTRLIRREITRFRGEEVDTAGDGFLAIFDGPARAVHCALASVSAVRELGLEIRAGLHTGEVVRAAGEPGGIAVHIGARIAALGGRGRSPGVQHGQGPGRRVRDQVHRARSPQAEGRARSMARLRGYAVTGTAPVARSARQRE